MCGGCSTTVYCGESCQDYHWKNGHAEECPVYAPLGPLELKGRAPRGASQQTIDASVIFRFRKGKKLSFLWIWENVLGPHVYLKPRAIIQDLRDIMQEDDDPDNLISETELVELRAARKDFFAWVIDNKQKKPDPFNDRYPTVELRNKLVAALFQAACSAKQKPGYDAPEILVAELIEVLEALRYKPVVLKKFYTDGFGVALQRNDVGVLRLLVDKGAAVGFDARLYYRPVLTEWISSNTTKSAYCITLLQSGVSAKSLVFKTKSLFGYACSNDLDNLVEYIAENQKSEISKADLKRKSLASYWRANNGEAQLLEIFCKHNLYKVTLKDLKYSMEEIRSSTCTKVCLKYGNFEPRVLETILDEALNDSSRYFRLQFLLIFAEYTNLTKKQVGTIISDIFAVLADYDASTMLQVNAARVCLKSGYVTLNEINRLYNHEHALYYMKKLCLEYGADLVTKDSWKLFENAADDNDWEFFKLLLAFENIDINPTWNGGKRSVLTLLCKEPETKIRLEIIESLLQKGADMNFNDNEPVHYIINTGPPEKPKIEMMKLFLKYGLDINIAVTNGLTRFRMLRMLLTDPEIGQTQISVELLDRIYKEYPDLRTAVTNIRKRIKAPEEAREPQSKLRKK